MNFSTSVSDRREKTYELRALLSRHNCQLHKFEKESGLTLAHYILENDGFKAVSLGKIVELTDEEPAEYRFYSFNDSKDYEYWAREAMRNFNALCEARRELLPTYESIWEHSGGYGEGVAVRFGLDTVALTIPIETLVKYQALYESPGIFSAYRQHFDAEKGCLRLEFIWRELSATAFDDKLFFLKWRVEEYQKQHKALQKLREFQNSCKTFLSWEKAIFATPLGSS